MVTQVSMDIVGPDWAHVGAMDIQGADFFPCTDSLIFDPGHPIWVSHSVFQTLGPNRIHEFTNGREHI